jgi:DNA polymerase-3 subunit epsilon
MRYPKPIVIVDVETSGMSPSRARIIEIACIRVENGKEVDRFVSLVDPDINIGREIQAITSITNDMVKDAPSFAQIAPRVDEIFKDAVLCAHNARFDYSFVKAEMERAGFSFKKQMLCTAKLSRSLFPKYKHHDLSSIIERHDIACAARHRAEGDADVLLRFLEMIDEDIKPAKLETALGKVSASSIPAQIDRTIVDALPESPGVYTFFGEDGEVLYIGKSVNVKSRVMSHFSNTHRDGKEMKLWQEVHDIGCERTVSDLGASLLELVKIKTEFPKYNRMSRKVESMWYLKKTVDPKGYIQFRLVADSKVNAKDFKTIYAVFKTKTQAVKALTIIARDNGLCPKLFGIEPTKGACFSYQIRKCSGACVGAVEADVYNRKVEALFAERRMREWPYKDKVTLRYHDEKSEKTELFIIDNWILEEAYVAETDEPEPFPAVSSLSKLFDYDVYKVLVRHLLKQ